MKRMCSRLLRAVVNTCLTDIKHITVRVVLCATSHSASCSTVWAEGLTSTLKKDLFQQFLTAGHIVIVAAVWWHVLNI